MQTNAGLIWITGFSSAGKTTVGRSVVRQLNERGIQSIWIDGDDLRAIFGNQFGFATAERKELAKIYMRLCSHLAAQGYTVVLSAIALFDEVEKWMRLTVPHSIQAYLDVPLEVRMERDKRGKGVYAGASTVAAYDPPSNADLVLQNTGSVPPDRLAKEIVDFYASKSGGDFGRTSHWNAYYSRAVAPHDPSSFAVAVGEELKSPIRLLEVGCGNGRDSFHFAKRGHHVVGIDPSGAAVAACARDVPQEASTRTQFLQADAPAFAACGETFDAIYCRFVLHAMPLAEEKETLGAMHKVLRPNGRVYIECRSINDPRARVGEIISATERFDGHYRRFIVQEDLVARVKEAGLHVVSCVESNGLAVHATEDPVVIRLVAESRG
jgi:bifunctional enzyme CysN/CysC